MEGNSDFEELTLEPTGLPTLNGKQEAMRLLRTAPGQLRIQTSNDAACRRARGKSGSAPFPMSGASSVILAPRGCYATGPGTSCMLWAVNPSTCLLSADRSCFLIIASPCSACRPSPIPSPACAIAKRRYVTPRVPHRHTTGFPPAAVKHTLCADALPSACTRCC